MLIVSKSSQKYDPEVNNPQLNLYRYVKVELAAHIFGLTYVDTDVKEYQHILMH